ncbi:MAG: leucyl/phenylalanyl-tRNA--protein transferase [Deltaproteobacteria bacterium]|nr:MAG: leucyl/phenylalanyl-tRNA--protein transferase [Deltaproteobacteria bacterium]TNF27809.1 MAG: leucyl/phenylalanyl-tRNA--protein transferase [Deltaproteobacteria bacterium]
MAIVDFPPIENADEHGLLALGGDLEISSLLLAYSRGIFPWPINEEYPLAWFSPDPRGILEYSNLHLSSSFKKYLRSDTHYATFNKDFDAVIRGCSTSSNRKDQVGTWITNDIINAYTRFFHSGHAYSVEVWNQAEELVGGLYGVVIGQYVSGESMFYMESNASKFALYSLMERLKENDILWLDTQMVTPVVESMGGIELERKKFVEKLQKSICQPSIPSLFT